MSLTSYKNEIINYLLDNGINYSIAKFFVDINITDIEISYDRDYDTLDIAQEILSRIKK